MRSLALLLCLCLAGCGKPDWHHAIVVDKAYVPANTSVAPVVGGKGGVVVTSTPQQFLVILKFDDGRFNALSMPPQFWASVEKGTNVEVDCRWWGIASVKSEKK